MRRPWISLVLAAIAVPLATCTRAAPDATARPGAADPTEAPFARQTFTYKTVAGTPIEADVYRADDDPVRPVLVWLHGGALMGGGRGGVPVEYLDFSRLAGAVLVSLDYRVAPRVQLPAIIEDLEDAFRWIRSDGPRLFHADPERLVVAGASAGGYLALVSGFRIDPRPDAIVSYSGYGSSNPEAWTPGVSGFDPVTEAAAFADYLPVHNVSAAYPPTLLIHGTRDDDVPFSESVDMADELSRHGVVHELILLEGSDHGQEGGDPVQESDAQNRALAFILRYLVGALDSSELARPLADFPPR